MVDYYQKTGFQAKESLFEYAFHKDLWTLLREKPSLHKDFLDYMKGRKDGDPRWIDYFPISTQVEDLSTAENAVTLVDIGGNLGHDLKLFQERCPEIPGRLILMDLPETIAGNSDPLEGIEKIKYDFFTPQPVQGNTSARFDLDKLIPERCQILYVSSNLPRLA